MSAFKHVQKKQSGVDKDEDAPSVHQQLNHQRVLTLSSRGVTFRQRHLLGDLLSMLPHARKDAKLDTKRDFSTLVELADIHNCNNILFFEARKRLDLYIWMAKAPNGPTVKLHCQNLHTMTELHFSGNCLKGSRPLLSFDASFDSAPHWQLLREMFTQIFGVPKGARKSKPFIDHVVNFTIADGKVWWRCYQIVESEPGKKKEGEDGGDAEAAAAAAAAAKKANKGETELSLVEIGPRMVLTPIVILEGCFGGPKIYENKEFVSPNQVRSELRRKKAGKYASRVEERVQREVKMRELAEKRKPREDEELMKMFE